MSGKPQVVFTVTSEGKDRWSAMTRLAIACVRATNPDLFVVVACDDESDRLLRRAGDPLVEAADRWVATTIPPGDPKFRNRFVKTSVRAIVDGPLLLIDSDVVVRRDLTRIFSLSADVACARNHSLDTYAKQIWQGDAAILDTMGWTTSQEVYFNAGVVYLNDTLNARLFSVEWQRLWLLSCSKCQAYRDQPAFNAALYNTKPKILVLSDKFNAQFKKRPSSVSGALLWHYYATWPEPFTTFEVAIQDIVRGGQLPNVRELIASRHPWRCERLIDVAAAAWLMHFGNENCWAAKLLRRELRNHPVSRVFAGVMAVKRSLLPINLRRAIHRRLGRASP
jgi:hypothetical protein